MPTPLRRSPSAPSHTVSQAEMARDDLALGSEVGLARAVGQHAADLLLARLLDARQRHISCKLKYSNKYLSAILDPGS